MIQNFRGKNAKDVETAAESFIYNSYFNNKITDNTKSSPTLTVTYQQNSNESFDNFLEKKK